MRRSALVIIEKHLLVLWIQWQHRNLFDFCSKHEAARAAHEFSPLRLLNKWNVQIKFQSRNSPSLYEYPFCISQNECRESALKISAHLTNSPFFILSDLKFAVILMWQFYNVSYFLLSRLSWQPSGFFLSLHSLLNFTQNLFNRQITNQGPKRLENPIYARTLGLVF
jgi:hypothetical protein